VKSIENQTQLKGNDWKWKKNAIMGRKLALSCCLLFVLHLQVVCVCVRLLVSKLTCDLADVLFGVLFLLIGGFIMMSCCAVDLVRFG